MRDRSHLRFLCFFIFFFGIFRSGLAERLECYVDEAEPKDDPNNIYHCESNTICCNEEGKSSCCGTKDITDATYDQLQLWGSLAGIIFILAIVMFCCRHDGDCCCNRKDGGRYKYFCCGPLVYREGKDPSGYTKESDSAEIQQVVGGPGIIGGLGGPGGKEMNKKPTNEVRPQGFEDDDDDDDDSDDDSDDSDEDSDEESDDDETPASVKNVNEKS